MKVMNILTFDIEEWFHLLDNPSTKTEKEWGNYETRIHENMDTIFEILDDSNASATFFVVGWIAERYPEVVRKIARRGYQIGSHTHMHQLAHEQDRTTFYNDVEKSIKTIEDCIGKKVEMFRAPGFSISEDNKWAFEVLHELGITTDSSVFPINHAHGGLKGYRNVEPSILKYNGITLKEFPINVHSVMGRPMVFSGGGYFRLLPYNLIKRATTKSDYVMGYFHPRDFDYDQPLIKELSPIRRFKSYVGLKSCRPKLEKWLDDFDFIDLSTASKQIKWDQKKVSVLD
ncbi:polysaccharide deacetylase family protein [Maribacter sp. X9]|uniref:polysaccharide deacetylase family protein n=1 Tax=Maribacter sp. X9 TaxID=3402159 RepID=UPI003AF3917C